MKRRRVLAAGAAVCATAGVAGCLGGDDDGDDERPEEGDEGDENRGFDALPRVEDPPEAVYLPTHRDGMVMLETVEAGDFAVTPMLSIPHFFWIWPGPEEVDPPASDAVHLMITVSDPETGTVLPVDAAATIELAKEGDHVSEVRPWTMISQDMGFHLGDNVPIDGNGSYTATVSLSPIADVRLTGTFEGRFDERATATIEFEIDDETRHQLVEGIEYFDEDRWGDRDAVAPMGHGHADEDGHGDHDEHGDEDHGDHEDAGHDAGGDGHDHGMPYSAAPPAEDLPGTLLGEPTHDDAVYATTLLPAGSRFVDGDEHYLAVSSRTPYNRCVLPGQSLSARLERDGETIDDPDLAATLDDELGFHYGAPIAEPRADDDLVVSVRSPPQVARHQGYETAFLSTGEMTIELEDV